MKLGSLFDGSGGFPLAGTLCGIEPVWASEVEPYPIAVTRSRFPKMKHLGDISKVNGGEIEPVDIITFGSPCQDLSVAGKRAGLKHEANGDDETTRSGLFMEAVRIIKEMRRATNGEYPTFALWENVPGAFSSNGGEDFRIVCEELIKIVEPTAVMPAVPKNGWAYADLYMGDGWSLAYRVFDAQYWGVPQRRRRIHLVLDLRGERAGEILFEREGVRGYFETGKTPWKGLASDAQDCPGADDRAVCFAGENITSPLNKTNPQPGDPCHTLGTDSRNYVVYPIHDKATRYKGGGPTRNGDGSGNGLGVGDVGAPMNTLTSADRHAVCYVFDKEVYNSGINASGGHYIAEGGPAPSLRATGQPPGVADCYIVRRLTPTECARLQGFPDKWGDIDEKATFTPEEFEFWHEVRNTHAAMNGKKVQDYTEQQMLTWYNKLHTGSAEYKMWGNGIALPPALYVMQGIKEAEA